ncbi:unnamed protein product [Amoebophrya sp. A120]|nr:unnamed protein product [Amoebophrya sp. A120]|eukprot:GSA120T00025329001.1
MSYAAAAVLENEETPLLLSDDKIANAPADRSREVDQCVSAEGSFEAGGTGTTAHSSGLLRSGVFWSGPPAMILVSCAFLCAGIGVSLCMGLFATGTKFGNEAARMNTSPSDENSTTNSSSSWSVGPGAPTFFNAFRGGGEPAARVGGNLPAALVAPSPPITQANPPQHESPLPPEATLPGVLGEPSPTSSGTLIPSSDAALLSATLPTTGGTSLIGCGQPASDGTSTSGGATPLTASPPSAGGVTVGGRDGLQQDSGHAGLPVFVQPELLTRTGVDVAQAGFLATPASSTTSRGAVVPVPAPHEIQLPAADSAHAASTCSTQDPCDGRAVTQPADVDDNTRPQSARDVVSIGARSNAGEAAALATNNDNSEEVEQSHDGLVARRRRHEETLPPQGTRHASSASGVLGSNASSRVVIPAPRHRTSSEQITAHRTSTSASAIGPSSAASNTSSGNSPLRFRRTMPRPASAAAPAPSSASASTSQDHSVPTLPLRGRSSSPAPAAGRGSSSNTRHQSVESNLVSQEDRAWSSSRGGVGARSIAAARPLYPDIPKTSELARSLSSSSLSPWRSSWPKPWSLPKVGGPGMNLFASKGRASSASETSGRRDAGHPSGPPIRALPMQPPPSRSARPNAAASPDFNSMRETNLGRIATQGTTFSSGTSGGQVVGPPPPAAPPALLPSPLCSPRLAPTAAGSPPAIDYNLSTPGGSDEEGEIDPRPRGRSNALAGPQWQRPPFRVPPWSTDEFGDNANYKNFSGGISRTRYWELAAAERELDEDHRIFRANRPSWICPISRQLMKDPVREPAPLDSRSPISTACFERRGPDGEVGIEPCEDLLLERRGIETGEIVVKRTGTVLYNAWEELGKRRMKDVKAQALAALPPNEIIRPGTTTVAILKYITCPILNTVPFDKNDVTYVYGVKCLHGDIRTRARIVSSLAYQRAYRPGGPRAALNPEMATIALHVHRLEEQGLISAWTSPRNASDPLGAHRCGVVPRGWTRRVSAGARMEKKGPVLVRWARFAAAAMEGRLEDPIAPPGLWHPQDQLRGQPVPPPPEELLQLIELFNAAPVSRSPRRFVEHVLKRPPYIDRMPGFVDDLESRVWYSASDDLWPGFE